MQEIFQNFTRKVFKNAKPFLKLPIIWLRIFEMNSIIISSQIIDKIFSKYADFWKTGYNFSQNEYSKRCCQINKYFQYFSKNRE